MAVPDFILSLRERIGTDPLWLSGVTAVVLDEDEARILLIRRADTGEWAPISGIIDPGEQPATAAIREVAEEAGVVIRVERLSGVGVTEPVQYANGDRAQYVDIIFRCRHLTGDPQPVDGEALEVAWFPVDALPEMRQEFVDRIRHGLSTGDAYFSIAATPASW